MKDQNFSTKALLVIILLLSIIIGSAAGFYFFNTKQEYPTSQIPTSQNVSVQHAVNQNTEKQVEGIVSQAVPFLPSKLIIPKLQINASIEYVGVDKNNNMDVPKQAMNVAWFSSGYKPGEVGNAVIAGHFDRKDGSPAIFYGLSKLSIGDTFTVISQEGKELTFRVTGRRTYDTNAFPIETVFGSFNKPRLNLITCSGDWNKNAQSYSKRTVVFSELENS